MNKVTVVESINVGNVTHIKKLPQPRKTIAASELSKVAGGKSADQTITSNRIKNETIFVGRVGDDDNGRFILEQLKGNGANVEHITVTPSGQTDQVYTLLQESGRDSIVIQHDANFDVTATDVRDAKSRIENNNFVIAQLETPLEATIEAFKIVRVTGRTTILNPAPARTNTPKELLELAGLITPDETETESIVGIKVDNEGSMKKNSELFHEMGIKGATITTSERGPYASYKDIEEVIPTSEVKAVDATTADGTFLGALFSKLKPDLSNLKENVVYAFKFFLFTIRKLSIFPSIPTRDVVEQALREN